MSICNVESCPSLSYFGEIPLQATRDIVFSRIGVGFETLDRELFDPTVTYPHLARLGAKWARCQTGWSRTERVKGRYDFAWLDSVVDNLLIAGVQPWMNVTYGNKLYTPNAVNESAVGHIPIHTAEEREGWSRFVTAMVTHFKTRVDHWEIWNEPNIDAFWYPDAPSAKEYAPFAVATSRLIKAAQPGAKVIVGALSPGHSGDFPWALPWPSFLEDCLALGMGQDADILSFHGYSGNTPEWHYREDIRLIRSLLKKYNVSLDLWQTEAGCSSSASHVAEWGEGIQFDETIQAKWVARRIIYDLACGLDYTGYFHTIDLGCLLPYTTADGKAKPPLYMGLLNGKDATPKPSFHTLQRICSLFDSDTRPDDFLFFTQPIRGERAEEMSTVGMMAACHLGFRRQGFPMAVYYLPENVLLPEPARTVDVVIPIMNDVHIRQPVLLDVLSGKIYDILSPKTQKGSAAHMTENRGFHIFENLPLTHSPLIVTDRAVVTGAR